MKVGIILGSILGIILILVSAIGMLLYKRHEISCKWPLWTALAGVCSLITANINALCMIL